MMVMIDEGGWWVFFCLFLLRVLLLNLKMIFSNIKEGFFEQRSQKGVWKIWYYFPQFLSLYLRRKEKSDRDEVKEEKKKKLKRSFEEEYKEEKREKLSYECSWRNKHAQSKTQREREIGMCVVKQRQKRKRNKTKSRKIKTGKREMCAYVHVYVSMYVFMYEMLLAVGAVLSLIYF